MSHLPLAYLIGQAANHNENYSKVHFNHLEIMKNKDFKLAFFLKSKESELWSNISFLHTDYTHIFYLNNTLIPLYICFSRSKQYWLIFKCKVFKVTLNVHLIGIMHHLVCAKLKVKVSIYFVTSVIIISFILNIVSHKNENRPFWP